jgi:hypothetical protein
MDQHQSQSLQQLDAAHHHQFVGAEVFAAQRMKIRHQKNPSSRRKPGPMSTLKKIKMDRGFRRDDDRKTGMTIKVKGL